ncbi:endonuclease domain-containing protein [Selenomonas sp.]|uniref:endonuclease domain-containing protein n=1 Tax=Selenomonas sp. TaxID=2053611 RepID=UPI002A75481E|nr:endonuclease domain-containing protein [Selenomonas sp.]MDY3296824.1 endonuclease domain-containing protein [Selenomonas sp.]MDY4417284.1 endonuclease domain-containing protein [Selenomonas sp.]
MFFQGAAGKGKTIDILSERFIWKGRFFVESYYYTSFARSRVKQLRKEMTREERHLWYDFLKGCPQKFQRQKAIGPYIVDFVCYSAKLVVELDGAQHYEAEALDHDERRTAYLREHGFRVLRFWNRDVQAHFDDVCAAIFQAMHSPMMDGRLYH